MHMSRFAEPDGRFHAWPLYSLCFIVAAVQGMLLPVLALLLERQGLSAAANGLHAAFLYVGIMVAAPLSERLVRRWGYRSVLVTGGSLLAGTLFFYPLWTSPAVWVVLRVLSGMGAEILHYAAHLWLTVRSPADRRGRIVSLYGMAYGLGFGVGPLVLPLLAFGPWVPFGVAAVLLVAALAAVWTNPPERPPSVTERRAERSLSLYARTWRLAYLALLPPALFGWMEATLTSLFPVYGARVGLAEAWISFSLSAFTVSSLVLQLPLAMAGDRWGRARLLPLLIAAGAVLFFLMPAAGRGMPLLVMMAVAGALVGSIYTLGLAYAADLLPKSLLPTANALGSIGFGVASIAGPNLGGLAMSHLHPWALFWVIGGPFAGYVALAWGSHWKRRARRTSARTPTLREERSVEA